MDPQSADIFLVPTATIVAAYAESHVVTPRDLAALIWVVSSSLRNVPSAAPFRAAAAEQKPAVSIHKSVEDGEITCLECGYAFKSLRRHLITHHSLTPTMYRKKWNLGPDYPMTAPEYSRRRSQMANAIGFGRSRSG